MKLTSLSSVIIRISLLALALFARPLSSYGQSSELEPVFFDENLQPIALKPMVEAASNLDVLHQETNLHWYSMFSQLPNDWANSASLVFRKESIPTVASLGVLTYALMRVDNETWRSTRRIVRQSETAHELGNYAVALGDGRLHLGIAGVLAGYGWLASDSKALRIASQTVEAFLATGLTVQILKRVTGRESPAAATHATGRWKFFPHPGQYNKHQPSYYAYPSGHISTAMATLTVVAENYPEQRWIKPVGYTLVGALGVGLVAKGMHWYSDLPAGIALGYIFGKVAANRELPDLVRSPKDGGMQVSVAPAFDAQWGSGIQLAVTF